MWYIYNAVCGFVHTSESSRQMVVKLEYHQFILIAINIKIPVLIHIIIYNREWFLAVFNPSRNSQKERETHTEKTIVKSEQEKHFLS